MPVKKKTVTGKKAVTKKAAAGKKATASKRGPGRPPRSTTEASAPKRRGRPPKSAGGGVSRPTLNATAQAAVDRAKEQKAKWRAKALAARAAEQAALKAVARLERKVTVLEQALETVFADRANALQQFVSKWEKDYFRALEKKIKAASGHRGRPPKKRPVNTAGTSAGSTRTTTKRRGRPAKKKT